MKIIVYEDRMLERLHMEHIIRKTRPEAELTAFAKTADALSYVKKHQPEVAFISVEHADGRGFFLIKKVKKISPNTNVIAVASRYRFLEELNALRISGYVTEDFTEERVEEEMACLRYACS